MLKFRYFLRRRDLRPPEERHALLGARERPGGPESWSVPWSQAAWRSCSIQCCVGSVVNASVMRG
jgi:hypothetical protein